MNKLHRFTSNEIQDYWKGNDHINELLLIKNQEFPTFEELVSKLEHISQLIRETYPKSLSLDQPSLQKIAFIYVYEKFDAIYRQELLTLQQLYLNPQDNNAVAQEIESKKKISTLLKFEMTIPRISKHENEIEITPNLANLLQVLFHDTGLLDKFLFTWCQKSFGYKIHTKEIIQLNSRIMSFIIPFFQNSTFIFDTKLDDTQGLITNILSQLKELLTNSTNFNEKQILSLYGDFELGLKSENTQRKILFSKPLALKQEFKNEGAYYELFGYLSLLSYCCSRNEEVNFARLQTLICFYAYNFSALSPENRQKYDFTLFNKLENVQPLPQLLQTKFIFSTIQKTLGGSFSEDLVELLEFQLLVVDAISEITSSYCFTSVNPSFTRENFYDAFFEGELNSQEENQCIWSQLYDFIDNNAEKLEKILSKHEFLLPQYYSLLQKWIQLLSDLQRESFLKRRVGDHDRVIPKYNKVHLKYLQKLLLLLASKKHFPKFLQEMIIDILEHAATLDSSYLSKFNLNKAFEVAEQQILEEFFPNMNDQLHLKKEQFIFPRILRVIGCCFISQWDYHSLGNDDNTLLTEMQNSKLFKEFFALYDEQSPKIASNLKDKSLLNDYLSIIQFLIVLEKASPVLYNDENYKPKFKLIFKDAMGSELQLIDQIQYSVLVNDLVRMMQTINFWNEPQDEQTIFLYFKFFFFQPKHKISSGNGEEYRFRNRFSHILEKIPDHKSLLAEIALSLLNILEAKTQDSTYDIWEELRKLEVDIIQKEKERIQKKQKEQEAAARANEEAKENNEEAKENNETIPEIPQVEVQQQEEEKKEDLPNIISNPEENQSKFKFGFSPESLVFEKDFDLQFYQDFTMRTTYKGLLTAYSVATFSGYIDHEKKHLIYDALKTSCKTAVTPLLIFMTPFCVSKTVYYLRETYYNGDNQLNSIIEGLIMGINSTFETFNLNDKVTFNSINMENIFVVMSEITEKNVVSIEAIPKSFTWREAAITSLILMLKNYGRYFKNEKPNVSNEFTPEFHKELSKANQSLKDLFSNLLKEMSRTFLNKHKNQDKVNWKGFSKDWLQVLSSIENIIGGWEGFCITIRKRTSSEKIVDDIYKSWVCEFNLISDTATYEEKRVNLAYNLAILNCFINILPCQNGNQYQKDVFIPLFSKTEIFGRVLSLEKDILSSYHSGSDSDDKSLELYFLETQSQRILRSFYNSESFNVTTFDNSGYEALVAQNFSKIKEFLTNPILSTIAKTNDETLITNIENAIDCCLDVYKIYGYFINHQANKVDTQLKQLQKDKKKKNKKDAGPRPVRDLFGESDDDDESMGFGLFGDPDDYYEPEAVEVVQEPQVEVVPQEAQIQIVSEEVQEAQPIQIEPTQVSEVQENTAVVLETQEEEEKKEETPLPKNEETLLPKNEETLLPKNEETPLPKNEETPSPRNEEIPPPTRQTEEEQKTDLLIEEAKVDTNTIENPQPKVEEDEVDDFFGGFNVDIEENPPAKKKDEGVRDEEMEKRITKLEDEKKQFYDQFKAEVESLLESCLPNLLLFTSFDDKLLNLKTTNVTISGEIWQKQYESLYKTTLLYLDGLLDESDAETKASLKKEASNIDQDPVNMDLFSSGGSSIKQLGELMALKLVYNSITKFYSSNGIQKKFKFSSDCAYGLVKATNSRLKELLTCQNLSLAKEELKKTQFFNSLANLLDDLAKLAIYFITKNNDSNSFLSLSLELFENSFRIHELALSDFDVSFLEEDSDLPTTLVNLANVTIAADKNLRVKFVDKGLLQKLLTTKKFKLWNRKEANALITLLGTLLEDSLPFETQVELQIKEFIRTNGDNKLSLDSLLKFSKFELFKNNPRSFGPVKAYGLVCKKNVDDETDVDLQLSFHDFEIQGDCIERTKLIDYTKGSSEKVNAIEYLQKTVSPLAQQCIQTVFRAFIENITFEKETITHCAKQKLEKEQKQQEAFSKLELQRVGDSNQEDAEDLLEVLQQNQNLAKIPLQDIRILLELLTSTMYNYPGLVPYLVFQEFEGGKNLDISKYLPQEPTVLDVLLTYTLCKDCENALFLVGSLLKRDDLSVELNQGTQTRIKNVFLFKIFEIINNILDIDNNQGVAFSNFDTTSTRFHIAQIVAFVNKLTSTGEGFDNKDKITDLVVLTFQKLLKNIKNVFGLVASTSGAHFMTQVSQIIRTNMPDAEGPKIAQDYVNLLKALEKDNFAPDKNFQFNKFNEFIFKRNEKDLELKQDEDKELKAYEMQKFNIMTGPASLCDLNIEFPIDGSAFISDELTLAQLWENIKNQNHQHIIYYRKQNQEPQEKNYIEYLDYYRQKRANLSSIPQSFKNRIDPDQDHFKNLDLFRSSQKASVDDLKNSSSLFSSFVKDEQAKIQKIIQQKTSNVESPPPNHEEEKVEQETPVTLFNEEDQQTTEQIYLDKGENANDDPFGGLFGGEEENPEDSSKVYPARPAHAAPEDLNRAEHFVRDKIQSESHFKYLVNKTLQKARRLKEIIQLEKTYNSMVRKEQTSGSQIEEIIKDFSKNLDEFDKNVIYTALGKEIQSNLSTEMQSHIEMLSKQFKTIKDDFYTYQTANEELLEKRKLEAQEKLEKAQPYVEANNPDNPPPEVENQNPEEVKENDPESEEIQENSHYDEYDYDDFKFVKDQENNNIEKKEEEEKKEDVPNLSDGGSVPSSQVIDSTDNQVLQDSQEDPEILKRIHFFRLDDMTILELCMPFFGEYSKKSSVNPITEFSNFFNNSLFANPANELAILDTLLFILYTPELIHSDELPYPLSSLCDSQKLYEIAAKNIIQHISSCLDKTNKAIRYFTPVTYLNKFGNKLLVNLKEKTGFYKKIESCYSILDLIIGLLENKTIIQEEQNVQYILDSVKNILSTNNNDIPIVLGRGNPQAVTLKTYKNYFSPKNLNILFNLSSETSSSDITESLSDLVESFKSQPKLLISMQDDLINIFSSSFGATNKTAEQTIQLIKQHESLTQDEFKKVLDSLLKLKQTKAIELTYRCFASACYEYCFSIEGKKDQKIVEKISSLLQTLVQTLFDQDDIQKQFVNVYELLEIIRKQQDSLQVSESLFEESVETLLKVCLFHYSMLLMASSLNTPSSKNPSAKGDSLPELDLLPKLKKLVTKDHYETKHLTTFQKTFSFYKSQPDLDFQAIFANFALKYSTPLSNLRSRSKDTNDQLLQNIFFLILPKCPWLLDLTSKKQIIREKIVAHLKKSGLEYVDDRRVIWVERKNLIHSSMHLFKDLEKYDILKNLNCRYKNEQGIDAGGLRREYYSLMGRELFAPDLGLFRVSANKRSIQPNPISSIIPNYLLYFEFAGLILAKAIEDEQLMDINFTKSFLKHIIGKETAISDLEDFDADLAKNLQWMLENDVEDLCATFTYETEIFDDRITQELHEGGFDTDVTEDNKKDYIKKVCEAKMTKEIERPIQSFLKGLHTILPKDCLSHLSSSELELIISGTPEIDLEDMKKYATYEGGYSLSTNIIKWLWEVLAEFNREELGAFLYFVSGTLKVPYGGFKDYPIYISKYYEKNALPVAHTCSWQMELPEYDTKEKLREKLLLVIFDGVDGFYIG